jgi:hypothetical protein
VGEKGILLDDLTTDEMFLNDAFNHVSRSTVVPNSFRIYQQNGPLLTDPQTIGLRAKDAGMRNFATRTVELQLLEPGFEIVPCFEASGAIATFRFGLIGTQKDVV